MNTRHVYPFVFENPEGSLGHVSLKTLWNPQDKTISQAAIPGSTVEEQLVIRLVSG